MKNEDYRNQILEIIELHNELIGQIGKKYAGVQSAAKDAILEAMKRKILAVQFHEPNREDNHSK